MSGPEILPRIEAYFSKRGWEPLPFQREAWDAYFAGDSALIHVPTGSGKTLSAFAAALASLDPKKGLQVLYVTPLRSLVRDIEHNLRDFLDEANPSVILESRTGDTSEKIRRRQQKRLPHVLLTTPESLSLMMTREKFREIFSDTRLVVVDEWHEFLSTKRGTQVELAIGHLKSAAPEVQIFALTGTLRNLEQAARAAVGTDRRPRVISQRLERPVEVLTLLPERAEQLPWAGHLGLSLLPTLLDFLDPEKTTLMFTNTRSQTELWFQAILDARPEMAGCLALHHGSLALRQRQFVERGLKQGTIRWVVCTSSLDLGVDFGSVENVVQIGSPKGIARVMQRAGRSQHRPYETCRIACLPTHALQLAEIAAVRLALARGDVEARVPLPHPVDALEQHIVTCALGGGITREDLLTELHRTEAYCDLTEEQLDWTIAHVQHGGSLKAYPDYLRIVNEPEGFRVANRRIARLHRLNIGTIVSDATVTLCYGSGARIGEVEESFVARLKPGDLFLFNGKTLEFIRLRELKAYVRNSRKTAQWTPRWLGGKLPISESLARELRSVLDLSRHHDYQGPEAEFLRQILAVQEKFSSIPAGDRALLETARTRDGYHAFLYPFEGRWVHQGLSTLLALRMAKRYPATFAISVNEYGIEFLAASPFPYDEVFADPEIFSSENLLRDIHEGMNLSELARRHFREVARVAGLIFQGYPGANKTARQLQTSSGLIFDVLKSHEPENLLVAQAEREVLERNFEMARLEKTLQRLRDQGVEPVAIPRLTPLALPLVTERLGTRLSTESLAKRVEQIQKSWKPRTTKSRS